MCVCKFMYRIYFRIYKKLVMAFILRWGRGFGRVEVVWDSDLFIVYFFVSFEILYFVYVLFI